MAPPKGRAGPLPGTERKLGRPSIFTQDIADEFCNRIAGGESARRICEDAHMPNLVTVMLWLPRPEHTAFLKQYREAREAQAEVYADQLHEIASKPLVGEVRTTKRVLVNGVLEVTEENVKTADNVARAALIVTTSQWLAERLKPKVYGPKKAELPDEADGESATKVVHHDAPPDPLLKPKE